MRPGAGRIRPGDVAESGVETLKFSQIDLWL